MARSFETRVYLVRVLTDDRTSRLWVAAGSSSEDAVRLVLNAIPEGWSGLAGAGPIDLRRNGTAQSETGRSPRDHTHHPHVL